MHTEKTLNFFNRLKGVSPQTIQIIRPFAQGGLSRIWLASHPDLSQPFLLKHSKFTKESNPYVFAQFEREFHISQRLWHDSIPKIFDFNIDEDGYPYLLLEYCDAQPLSSLNYPLHWTQFKQYLLDVLKLLQYCHEHRVIHRDIKPENILVSDSGCHLIDFGLAILDGRPLSSHSLSMAIGTPRFMAPEQARGEYQSIGSYTDLYALGISIYELCSGRQAFVAKTDKELMEKHCRVPLPTPTFERILQPPLGFSDFIIKLTQKSINNRYQTASEALIFLSGL